MVKAQNLRLFQKGRLVCPRFYRWDDTSNATHIYADVALFVGVLCFDVSSAEVRTVPCGRVKRSTGLKNHYGQRACLNYSADREGVLLSLRPVPSIGNVRGRGRII